MMVVLIFLFGIFFVEVAIIFIEDMVMKHRQSSGGCYKCKINDKDEILILDWNKNNQSYYVYNSNTSRTIISGTKKVCESYLAAIGAVEIKSN